MRRSAGVSEAGARCRNPEQSEGLREEELRGSNGGEGGIRTLGTGVSPYNGLANRRIRPLCHLSGDGFSAVYHECRPHSDTPCRYASPITAAGLCRIAVKGCQVRFSLSPWRCAPNVASDLFRLAPNRKALAKSGRNGTTLSYPNIAISIIDQQSKRAIAWLHQPLASGRRRGRSCRYCSFASSAFACFRMGISGSASFQSVRKSL